MKKVFILLCVLSGIFMIQPSGLCAQPTTNPNMTTMPVAPQLDAKTQKKVDKAKADLAKDQKNLEKKQADFAKERDNFQKKQSNGKLSPNDVVKGQKSLDKASRDIDKLKKAIADNEKFLAGFNK